jgi:hypothetical protein
MSRIEADSPRLSAAKLEESVRGEIQTVFRFRETYLTRDFSQDFEAYA